MHHLAVCWLPESKMNKLKYLHNLFVIFEFGRNKNNYEGRFILYQEDWVSIKVAGHRKFHSATTQFQSLQ